MRCSFLVHLWLQQIKSSLGTTKKLYHSYLERSSITQPGFRLFQVNNRNTKNTKTICEMCLKLTARIPERPQ